MTYQTAVKPAAGLGYVWDTDCRLQFSHRAFGKGFSEPEKVQLLLREKCFGSSWRRVTGCTSQVKGLEEEGLIEAQSSC